MFRNAPDVEWQAASQPRCSAFCFNGRFDPAWRGALASAEPEAPGEPADGLAEAEGAALDAGIRDAFAGMTLPSVKHPFLVCCFREKRAEWLSPRKMLLPHVDPG